MNKDEQDNKKFLEQQLQWCKNQGRILEEIEMKLYKMKEIAQGKRWDGSRVSLKVKDLW